MNAIHPQHRKIGAAGKTKTFQEELNVIAAGGAESIVALVDAILAEGIRLGASDIHLEPTAKAVLVRYRLDGVMQDFGVLPQELGANLSARCKVPAQLLTYRTDIPQEGGASLRRDGVAFELRVSTFPTLHGERVAVRIFDPRATRGSLDELGLPAEVATRLDAALRAPDGLIVLAGPAGSGKTTTLYASLGHIGAVAGGGRSIVTVEDPVENRLAGVTQTAIRPAVGLTFATSLRSLLRQDPEVIMIGEMRDTETARIAVEATLTGHLVLSTLHAAAAATVPHRLLDMELEPYALAGTLRLVLAQRLVRALCDTCKRPLNEKEAAGISADAPAVAHAATGCSACYGAGYRGRRLLVEYLDANDELHEAIMAKASRVRFAAIAEGCGPRLPARGRALVREGITSAEEVRRVLGDRG